MGIGSILGLLKGIVELVLAIPEWIEKWRASKVRDEADKRSSEIRQGTEDAKKAKSIEEKAAAACRIEKALNPDSNCDGSKNEGA